DFQQADMPPKTLPFWKLVGPGAIMVGLSIGSGELIMWPRLVAQHGAGMIWAAGVGVFMQLWVNFELGRYTLATGESVYTGFARVSRLFVPLFLLLNVLSCILPGWATSSGAALKALLTGSTPQPGEAFLWTWTTMGVVALLLFGPKMIYAAVEKAETALVTLITIGLIITAIAVSSQDLWRQLLHGAVNFGYIDPAVNKSEFFAALVYAGAGGTSNIFLCYYLRDKNLGMGALIPDIVNPLRGQTEKVPSTGFLFPETQENISRFRQWMSHFRKEQMLIFWLLNSLTILLFIFGSLAVLHPQGEVPTGMAIATTQAKILAQTMGAFGEKLFLIVAFATLFSTQLALIDGAARAVSDMLYVNFPAAQRKSLSWWYTVIAGGWIGAGCLLALFEIPPFLQLLFNACLGGVAMAIYVPLTLYINKRFLPRSIRPDLLSTFFLLAASALYIFFALWYAVFGLWQG
ncbi:MAG: Nramp family divalent metal transporter, partial [Abditibacteriales bacterium]|nr:Nramp family divalent metal transporter [Abditibacteriales bacterium]